MQSLKNKILPQIFIIYLRYLIGGAFVFASLIKIKGERFTSMSGANEAINTSWHFFETMYQSGLYWKFIGIGQLVAGFLLMTQRYAKLGACANLPIISSVFVITLSYDFGGTPIITGFMLLGNLLFIAWDWNELKILVNQKPIFDEMIFEKPRLEKDSIWVIIGLLLFSFTFIYRLFINQYDMLFWFLTCVIIGVIGLFFGLRNKVLSKT